MTPNQPKIELVIRRSQSCLIIAAVMLTTSFKVGNLAAMELRGLVDGNQVRLQMGKAQYEPTNDYRESLQKESLAELARTTCWRGYQTTNPQAFGGIIIGRDSMLFDFESSASTSRIALVSVIQDPDNLLDIDSHAVYRSILGTENVESFEFVLERDTSKATSDLIESLTGEAFLSFYKMPFFTLHDGSPYRLITDLPAQSFELLHQKYKETVELGAVTEETKKKLQDAWLYTHINNDSDFDAFIKAIAPRTPLFFEKFKRLLTEAEHQDISHVIDSYLHDCMHSAA